MVVIKKKVIEKSRMFNKLQTSTKNVFYRHIYENVVMFKNCLIYGTPGEDTLQVRRNIANIINKK